MPPIALCHDAEGGEAGHEGALAGSTSSVSSVGQAPASGTFADHPHPSPHFLGHPILDYDYGKWHSSK